MSFAVARMTKLKADNLVGIGNHDQRKTTNHSNEDIDVSRSHLNYDLVVGRTDNFKTDIEAYINENKASKRAVRKDAVLVNEWILTSDKDFFEQLDEAETRKYFETAKQYLSKDARVTVVLGANDAGSVFYVDEFKALGCDVYVATMDGSLGTKGTALDAIKENNVTCPFVLSCGPLPMLKAINEQYSEGYISLEARMACGLGACMGCVVKDVEGHSLRVCKDGPVFEMGKVAL